MTTVALNKYPPAAPLADAYETRAGTSLPPVFEKQPTAISVKVHELAHHGHHNRNITIQTGPLLDTNVCVAGLGGTGSLTALTITNLEYPRMAPTGFVRCKHTYDIDLRIMTPHDQRTITAASAFRCATLFDQRTNATDNRLLDHIDVILKDRALTSDPLKNYDAYTRPNWDSYDAQPITPATIAAARAFIRALPHQLASPDIAPGADGTIGLEWTRDYGPFETLLIDIGPGRTWNAFWRAHTGETRSIPHQPIDDNTNKIILERIIHA